LTASWTYAFSRITAQDLFVDAEFVHNLSTGRIEEMKIFKRNLLLASSALALAMLFGCSSSEEAPPPDDTSGGGHDCSMYPVEAAREECQALKDAAN
jgi:hypothetical protein